MAEICDARIEKLEVSAFKVPTSSPEADGTLSWTHTTIVIARAEGGGRHGLGYTYADVSTAQLIESELKSVVTGRKAVETHAAWIAMTRAIRNLGRPGISSMAIAAVDCALWDLKARLLGVPLAVAAGFARPEIPVYGSGGFTSYSDRQLEEQLGGWAREGIKSVKLKVGSCPQNDPGRVRAARGAIGPDVELFVDANGAYSRKQALEKAIQFRESGVKWFEEPVPSSDLEGLRLMRDRAPAGMEIAAGEYGYDAQYFRRMLESGAVDVLQADATRCAGVTGFLQADALCQGFEIPLSAHTAPSLHGQLCCAAISARNVEYFYDHVRIERMFFDGALQADHGMLRPCLSSPGLGIEIKLQDVERYRVYGRSDSSRSN